METATANVYPYEVDESTGLITLELVKAHLAVDHDQDDLMLTEIIKAAQSHVEDLTGLRLYDTSIAERYKVSDLMLDEPQELAYFPFIESLGFAYVDSPTISVALDGLQTSGDATIDVEGFLRKATFAPKAAMVSSMREYVIVAYKAGVSSLVGGSNVLKQAALLIAASMYEVRESEVTTRISENPMLARLLANYRCF